MKLVKAMKWKVSQLFVKEVSIFVKKLLIVFNITHLIRPIKWLRLKLTGNLILKKTEINIALIKLKLFVN